jgi:alkanesulfonate monooxygenase SsuD/methylene tetrahydromethanopterin reductase-like flavin-dependent oxidoreductase (luciferase family)
MQQAFVALRSGRPGKLQPARPGYLDSIGPQERAMLDQVLSASAIGSPATVQRELEAFVARTDADELMVTSQIFDHAARIRSYDITAQVRDAAK